MMPKLAKYLGLNIEFVNKEEVENYSKKFPLHHAPTLENSSGFKLTETIAIIQYLISKSNNPELLGTTDEEKALNMKWESYVNSDFFTACIGYIFSKTENERKKHFTEVTAGFNYITSQLMKTKYLTGNNLLACDILGAEILLLILGAASNEDLSPYTKIREYVANVEKHLKKG